MHKKIKRWTSHFALGCQYCYLKSSLLRQVHIVVNFHRIRSERAESLKEVFDSCPSLPVDIFMKILITVKNNFDIVSLSTFCENRSSPLPLAAITFDDGWKDNFDLAFPILQKLKIPATIFMVTGKIGSAEPFWQQKLGRAFHEAINQGDLALESDFRKWIAVDQKVFLDKILYIETVKKWKTQRFKDLQEKINSLPVMAGDYQTRLFLNEQEITQMSHHGIDFGAHTIDHVILTNEAEEEVFFQLLESKKHLEKLLLKPVYALAYPNGAYSRNIIKMAQKSGYTIGCSTNGHKINSHAHRLKIPRIDMCLENWDKFLSCPAHKKERFSPYFSS